MFFLSLITEIELTVGTSVGLQSESDPPAEIPVQGEEAEESSHRRLLQLVLNHTVSVTVPWKSLGTHRCGGNIDQHLLMNDPVFHRVNTPTICGTVCGGTSSRTRTAPTPAAPTRAVKNLNKSRLFRGISDTDCHQVKTNDTTGRPVLVRSWFLSLM